MPETGPMGSFPRAGPPAKGCRRMDSSRREVLRAQVADGEMEEVGIATLDTERGQACQGTPLVVAEVASPVPMCPVYAVDSFQVVPPSKEASPVALDAQKGPTGPGTPATPLDVALPVPTPSAYAPDSWKMPKAPYSKTHEAVLASVSGKHTTAEKVMPRASEPEVRKETERLACDGGSERKVLREEEHKALDRLQALDRLEQQIQSCPTEVAQLRRVEADTGEALATRERAREKELLRSKEEELLRLKKKQEAELEERAAQLAAKETAMEDQKAELKEREARLDRQKRKSQEQQEQVDAKKAEALREKARVLAEKSALEEEKVQLQLMKEDMEAQAELQEMQRRQLEQREREQAEKERLLRQKETWLQEANHEASIRRYEHRQALEELPINVGIGAELYKQRDRLKQIKNENRRVSRHSETSSVSEMDD